MSTPRVPEQSPAGLLSGIPGDVRHALRLLWKSRGLSSATLLTLALCIGATTAIFSMVYSLMLKPLPFHEPDRIVDLYSSAKKAGLHKMPANVPIFLDYSKNATSYETLALWQQAELRFGEETATESAWGARATAGIFEILRVQPVLGTFFTAEQNRQGADKVVVLTWSFWQSRFGGDPGVLGKSVRIDVDTYKVIGVAPRSFEAMDARVKFVSAMAWPPQAENPQARYGVGLQLYGRLKPGVTVAQADAEAKLLEKRYVESSPPGVAQFVERSGMTMNVGGVQEQRVAPVRPTMLLLQGGVAFVLLIGCVNVANLLLVRSNARQSELAIRSALGASRAAIARQLLVESLLLTGLGAALGVALAWGALRAINFYTSKMLPQALPSALDWRVLAFASGLAVVVGLLIGLVPVFHVLRTNLAEVIQRSSRSASSGRGVRLLSSGLVVTQVAVALMLLTGAGLLIHSFARALSVDRGFDPAHVIGAGISLPAAHRADDTVAKTVRDRVLAAMREIPGVDAATLSFATPYRGGLGINALTLADDPLPPGSPQPGAYRVVVTPGYLDTLRLRLVEGRFFEEADIAARPDRYVVDEDFARKFFPNRSAIGGRFTFGQRPEKPEDWPTIIGVVRNVPHNGVEEKSGNPFIYQVMRGRPGGFALYVRTQRSLEDMTALLRAKLKEIDPEITAVSTATLESAIHESYDNRRAVMLLLAAFAGLALFLSALGIYGVLAYDVSQRTREIGVRGAIGASQGQIVGLILRQGLWKTGIGLAIGLAGAFALSRYMTSLLFQVKPTDPLVYVAVSGVLIVVALLASYLPARRAAKIDPLVALREE
jgi:putative ABC transport system permease protein